MLGFLLSACACTLRSMFRRTYEADVLLTPIHTCTEFKHSSCRSIIMFLASSSFPCMLWDAACVWGQCLLILVLTLPSGMSFWCTDGIRYTVETFFMEESGCQLFTLSGFPCFKVSAHIFCLCVLYILSWHALLASSNHEVWAHLEMGEFTVYQSMIHYIILTVITCWFIFICFIAQNFSRGD